MIIFDFVPVHRGRATMRSIFRFSGREGFAADAVRDLLVVIVGILAALWIDAFWQDRQDRAEERQILTGLHQEFSANRDQLRRIVEVTQDAAVAAAELHELSLHPFPDDIDVQADRLLTTIFTKKRFDARSGQLTSAISSGKLALIENRELQALIADWPDLVADIEDNERMLWDHFQNKLMPHVTAITGGWEVSAFPRAITALWETPVFDDLLSVDETYSNSFIEESRDVMATTERIINLIELELGLPGG